MDPLDISYTEAATHVYVKKENPLGLASKFEGPYKIISRPSRSTIEVRIGSYTDGRPRLQIYNWQQAKIAHLREDAVEGQRPRLGRPAASSSNDVPNPTEAPTSIDSKMADEVNKPNDLPVESVPKKPAKFKPSSDPSENNTGTRNNRPVRSTRNPAPNYDNR